MNTAITIIHVLACLFLIIVILLQTGKGGDMGAAFGGSSSSTFGGQGAGTFLSKTTAVIAALFMITSLSLAILSSRIDEESVISDDIVPIQSTAPVIPPGKPRMEKDPEAVKVETTPMTAKPAQAPENAKKKTATTPVAKIPQAAVGEKQAVKTPKPSDKNGKTPPTPVSPAP